MFNSTFILNHETKFPAEGASLEAVVRQSLTTLSKVEGQTYDCSGHARPNRWHNHPSGLAGLAFEAEFYLRQRRISLRLRLRLEGSPFWPSFGEMVIIIWITLDDESCGGARLETADVELNGSCQAPTIGVSSNGVGEGPSRQRPIGCGRMPCPSAAFSEETSCQFL